MSDFVLKEDSDSMANSSGEVRKEVEHAQNSSGEVPNSTTKDSSSSFLLNQQKFEVESSQSVPTNVAISAPPTSDHQVTPTSKLDVAFEQIKVEESLKHSLKKSLTATSHSSSDQQLKGESNSKIDSVSYQTEIKAEKSISSSSTRKVSAIISALDPKKSQAPPELPRAQETVSQPPPPVEVVSVEIPPLTEVVPARISPEIQSPTEPVSAIGPPDIEPMDVSARISLQTPPDYENSQNSASSDVKRTKKVPNYMAATASAKAKVRSLSIPKHSPEVQEKKRTPTGSSAKPPPFHETLRTPQRSISQGRRNIQGNGNAISLGDSTGYPEKSKRDWRS